MLTGTAALDLVLSRRPGRRRSRTQSGDVDADHVVCAIDPRRLPALAPYVERTMPAIPPVVSHVGLVGRRSPTCPHEVVLHGDPMLVRAHRRPAPAGAHAWTVLGRGRLAEDIAARAGAAPDRRPRPGRGPRRPLARASWSSDWGGSPYGVLWQGRDTVRRRLGPRTPIAGVYAAGAHATPGAGLPFVGLSAALVAQVIGAGADGQTGVRPSGDLSAAKISRVALDRFSV